MSFKSIVDICDALEEYFESRSSNTLAMPERWANMPDYIQEMLFEVCVNYIRRVARRDTFDPNTYMHEYGRQARETVEFWNSIGK